MGSRDLERRLGNRESVTTCAMIIDGARARVQEKMPGDHHPVTAGRCPGAYAYATVVFGDATPS